MDSSGSITHWLERFRSGDRAAAAQLWDRFALRLRQLARPRAQPHVTGGVYDEEDVALSAFTAFCLAVEGGRYPRLRGREELWRILATITLRKARERAQHMHAQKRGPGITLQSTGRRGDSDAALTMDHLPSPAPPPDCEALMDEQVQHLLGLLNDPELQAVALGKLEGQTNEELAQQLGYTRRTIQRMLVLIRRLWEAHV